MPLPDRGWRAYEDALKRLGERRSANGDDGLLGFLVELGLVRHDFGVSRDDYSALTDVGTEYFTARFVTDNSERVAEILHKSVLAYPPAAAISELLAGVAGANRDRAETILRSQGFAAGLTERALGSLLTLMSTAWVIDYVPRRGTL